MNTLPVYSEARFALWFERGAFALNDAQSECFWTGQDGNIWVQYYFPRTYQRISRPVAKLSEAR